MLFQDTIKALKATQRDKLEIEIETDNNRNTINVANKLSLNALIVEDNLITTTIENRNVIPILIDELRKNQIKIYQIKIKDNLEELFLSLTKN